MNYDILRSFRHSIDRRRVEDHVIEDAVQPLQSHLNLYFYDNQYADRKSFVFGSFRRGTAIPEFSHIDLFYILPEKLRLHFAETAFDTSSLLSDLLNQIFNGTRWTALYDPSSMTFSVPETQPWPTRIKFGFKIDEHRFLATPPKWTGSNGIFQPFIADATFRSANFHSNRNLEILTKTARYWVHTNHVPMSGFLIDCLAMTFIRSSPYRNLSINYHDCLLRDFFFFLSQAERHQESWLIEGSEEQVYRTGQFEDRAQHAYLLVENMIANSALRHDEIARNALSRLVGGVSV